MARVENPVAQHWPDLWVLDVLREAKRYEDTDRPMLERLMQRTAWQAAVAARLATDAWLLEAVAARYGLAAHTLEAPDRAAAELLDEGFVRQQRAVPVAMRDRVLVLAAADPLPLELERLAAFAAGCRVEVVLASPDAIDAAIELLYPSSNEVERLVSTLTREQDEPGAAPAGGLDVIRLVDALIVDAIHRRSTEVHLEPDEAGMAVRYRVDGVLHEAVRVPRPWVRALVSHVKALAGMDIAERLRPQDGRAQARVDGNQVELRVSALPVLGSVEKLVIRLAEADAGTRTFEELGFSLAERARIERMLAAEDGLILVAGAAGSGRTTTLYAALRRYQSAGHELVTVEDPIACRLPGVTQVQVNERVGLTYPHALRSAMRQHADGLLVGELGDLQTADLAVEMSLSGRRVISSVATPDASSAILRLMAMGVEAGALAASLRGVVAQRLVRRVCTACREPIQPGNLPTAQRAWLADTFVQQLYRAVGCPRCQDTGYYGRTVIAEVAMVTSTIANAIGRRADAEELAELCGAAGMLTLWESGLARVAEGSTTMEELLETVQPPGSADSESGNTSSPVRLRMVRRALETILREAPDDSGGGKTIVFPVNRRQETANLSEVDHPLVLVVEDDLAVRNVLRMGLEREGFRVDDLADGRAALRYLQGHSPRAVVLDLTLPRVDGIGVLQAMKAGVAPQVPVLVLTGQDDPDIAAWTEELGAAGFISKPVTPRTVGVRLRSLLADQPAPALTG
ncbi:MAG: type II/IV secretion system protein [Gemmatimonadota bacterium]